ncbi:MAG: hydrogenase expression/formation protein HypE [Acidobacteria bacterium RIFCSPLOWO2_02_FULL_68_18]|nr:MAG: hydrogenase expression/formation protein HypE [Acidobacteria bacterium RIFCSPLOWO2_02_FULL_68_18]OFW48685.1 MAG: hydrogenase expression/formation protein HypE [Acidobacteria bacterium RIFCSPLOWO2_12_FULL_68_19]
MRSALDDRITLKYGAGGQAMRALIREVFLDGMIPAHPNGDIGLAAMDDGAALRVGDRWLVVTTDSHVIHPIFFPGGDIGRLAVSGTVNDLAMMGATDVLGLTCAVIIEEGFSRADLVRIQQSIRAACEEAGAMVVAGDTKVMGRGELDGVVLNTTGIAMSDRVVPDSGLRPGDCLVVTGTLGDHGMAVMARRHGLALDADLRSDVAPLNGLVRAALDAAPAAIVAMKDPTRGGLASALHEMAEKSGVGVLLDELALPIAPAVRAASELLGIDPLHVANEGKAVIGVRPEAVGTVLDRLRAHPLGRHAALIGRCVAERPGSIVLDTGFGRRLVTEPEGEPLPRIC